jgi:hypothetical protein
MCSTNALSMCLASLTSVPLNEISDIKMYRSVFCIVAELMNALAVHRLDVLSFRMQVYLQVMLGDIYRFQLALFSYIFCGQTSCSRMSWLRFLWLNIIRFLLQCFQYVVESITMRADQKNNLTDDEILDLKYCAHSIERYIYIYI